MPFRAWIFTLKAALRRAPKWLGATACAYLGCRCACVEPLRYFGGKTPLSASKDGLRPISMCEKARAAAKSGLPSYIALQRARCSAHWMRGSWSGVCANSQRSRPARDFICILSSSLPVISTIRVWNSALVLDISLSFGPSTIDIAWFMTCCSTGEGAPFAATSAARRAAKTSRHRRRSNSSSTSLSVICLMMAPRRG